VLCLNRKSGQAIQINDDITITVLDIKKNIVRIGIQYTTDARVLRHEVYEKVQLENKESTIKNRDVSGVLEGIKKLQEKGLKSLKEKIKK
jgi:carbon storage regulator